MIQTSMDLRPIDGYPGYHVTQEGEVWSVRTGGPRKRLPAPRKLKPWIGKNRYMYVTLRCDGQSSKQSVHRIVATAFVFRPDSANVVLHLDDDTHNNKAANLAWGTQAENIHDAVTKQRICRGERCPQAQLYPLDVLCIRERSRRGEQSHRIAILYGVHPGTISDIVRYKNWKHLP